MYVQHGENRPLSGLGFSSGTTATNESNTDITYIRDAYISVFGPQPGDVVGKDILGQYISAMDFLAASRANLMAAANLKFWTRSKNGYSSEASQKGPGFLAFDTPRDARFAFDVACIQKLAGFKPTGVVDRPTLELLFALDEKPFRDSWPGKWAHTNTIHELGRSSESDYTARIIAKDISFTQPGKYPSGVWKTRSASMTLANKVMNAAGKSNKPAYPAAVTIALTCQRNLRLALRDIWWVGKDSLASTPESPDVYQAIVEFTNATGRSAVRQRAGQLGAAEPDIMSLLKAHVSINSGLANIQPRPVKRIFMFVNDSTDLPPSPRIVIQNINGYYVKSKIIAKNYLDKAVADLNTSERIDAQNRARTAARLEERREREAEQRRQEEQRKQQEQRRQEEQRKQQQQRDASAASNRANAEKFKIKLKVLNDGVLYLNDKKKLNAPLGYYLAEIEKLLLAIPADLRVEFTADIKAALTAHLYSIMPQLKQGSPEYIKAQQEKAEKDRIAAETLARLKAQADAIAAETEAKRVAAEAEAQRLAAEQAAAAEAQRVADEQAAAARTVEEKRIADENAARAAAEKAAADAAAAEAKRVADEAAAKSAADADAAAKLEEERKKAASGESTPEDVVSKTVAIVNDMTDGEGGLEIAKEVINNAVSDDPSKAESGNQLIKAAEDAPKQASAGGGGGLAVVAALGIGAFLLFGRSR
jgi:hypothetical protein